MQPKELLKSARTEFLNSFQSAIQFIVSPAIEALFVKANASQSPLEKAEIFHARVILQEHRQELTRQLILNMIELLDRSIETTYQAFRPTSSALSLSLDNIGLLDSSTFENSLRFNNIIQLFRDCAEQELIDLNIRLSVLFNENDIRERENPFRPYLLARCISASVETLKLSPELTAILVTQIGETISNYVKAMYQRANAELAKHGVNVHLSLKINKVPPTPPPRSTLSTLFDDAQSHHLGVSRPEKRIASVTSPSYATASGGFPQLITKPAINIHQLFLAVRGRAGFSKATADQIGLGDHESEPLCWLEGGAGLGDVLRMAFGAEEDLSWETKSRWHPLSPATLATNNVIKQNVAVSRQLIQRLQLAHESSARPSEGVGRQQETFSFAGLDFPSIVGQMHKLLTPRYRDMLNEQGEVKNLLYQEREVLLQFARSNEERMKIDVVALVFESILFDSLLSLELRIQIGRVQFLFLQLALIEADFLRSVQHPARLLLNRIAVVSLGVQHIESQKIQFDLEIERIFKTLAKHDCSIPGLFQRIINRFDIFVLRELRIQDKVIRRTVKSVEEAQIRYSQFEQTASTLRAALLPFGLPPQFLAFLETEWVRAINLADRKEPELASDLRAFVPDVVWSIRPKISREDKLQFSELMPPMMDSLRRGMEIMELNQFKQHALFNWLSDAHHRAQNPQLGTVADFSLQKVRALFDDFMRQPALVISDIATEDKFEEMRKYLVDILQELGLNVMMLTSDEFHSQGIQSGATRLSPPIKTIDVDAMRAQLVAGAAIEMNLDDKFWRGCIHWINVGADSMVLSFKSHAAPAVISIDNFCANLSRGTARLVENASLFDRAIAVVLKSVDALDA